MNPPPPDDAVDRRGTADASQPDFATILDALEGRLSDADQRRVEDQLVAAGRSSVETASWIRSFLDAARRYRDGHVPARVGTLLHQRYAEWWAERSDAELGLDWDELAARLIFDSRRTVDLVGVRGTSSGEVVQFAYALGATDVVVDVVPMPDGAVRIEGQVLVSELDRGSGPDSESEADPAPVSVSLRGRDVELQHAMLDHLDRFAFEPAHGPDLEHLVHASRRRWRLPLSPQRHS